MTDVEKMLSDQKRWKLVAIQAEERKQRLKSFRNECLGNSGREESQAGFIRRRSRRRLCQRRTAAQQGLQIRRNIKPRKSFVTKRSNVLVVGRAYRNARHRAFPRLPRHLVAIEANPHTFAFLKTNILLNERPNIEAHNIAAGEGTRKIQFLLNRANSSGSEKRAAKVGQSRLYLRSAENN